ncbi:MAG: RNA 3'-terminal phosphate cyclase [Candidatus Aenigmarchaeota archaeon]|nr:RNA 3'-terminal phosphate cyclase [Candidatus Aenigmarchaeota archaeon]
MIEIDGNDAGGQLVRTAVSLSAITGKAFRIVNIRGARPQPGLKAQHMEGIGTVAELCSAKVSGLELGSKELEFIPGKLEPKNLEVKISTAGSIGLVLQSLLIDATKFEKPINVKFSGGGTWGKWAPPMLYLEKVFLPCLCSGLKTKVKREGFYPRGGAEVEVEITPIKVKSIEILEHGKLLELNIFSVAAQLEGKKVAERQAEAARSFLEERIGVKVSVKTTYSAAENPGSGILIVGKCENSVIGADSIGELNVPAEEVGKRAGKDFFNEFANGAVDRHCADMLLPYIALAGKGRIKTSEITQHIVTSIELIEKFLPVKFSIDREKKIISVL